MLYCQCFLVNDMTNFSVKLADVNIGVTSIYDTTKIFCTDYLTNDLPDFTVTITESDIEHEKNKSRKHSPDLKFTPEYLETLAVYRKIAEKMPEYDTILFHGSVIAVDGIAYMFTAKSGTGKSTHARLWRELLGSRAVMINDDKPLLKITDTAVTAYGTPWNGKHRLGCNISAPLKAVCVLSRSEQNGIEPLTKAEALKHLYTQTYRPESLTSAQKTMKLIDDLANTVKLYSLKCNMHPTAAQTAYNAIKD